MGHVYEYVTYYIILYYKSSLTQPLIHLEYIGITRISSLTPPIFATCNPTARIIISCRVDEASSQSHVAGDDHSSVQWRGMYTEIHQLWCNVYIAGNTWSFQYIWRLSYQLMLVYICVFYSTAHSVCMVHTQLSYSWHSWKDNQHDVWFTKFSNSIIRGGLSWSRHCQTSAIMLGCWIILVDISSARMISSPSREFKDLGGRLSYK